LFTEHITKRGEKWFRFAFELEDKEAHFDLGELRKKQYLLKKG